MPTTDTVRRSIHDAGPDSLVVATAIWRVEGGKIVESWHELDTLGLMQQLGAIPKP